MKKKTIIKLVIFAFAAVVGVGIGFTGAYFTTQRVATGTINLLDNIELVYTGMTEEYGDYFLQLSPNSGIFPNTDVTLTQVTVAKSSNANKSPAIVRFSLNYWYRTDSSESYTKANGVNDPNLHISTHPSVSSSFTTAGKYNYLTGSTVNREMVYGDLTQITTTPVNLFSTLVYHIDDDAPAGLDIKIQLVIDGLQPTETAVTQQWGANWNKELAYLNIDGEVQEYSFTYGDLPSAIDTTYNSRAVNDLNTCGWFSDKNYAQGINYSSALVNEEIYYTRMENAIGTTGVMTMANAGQAICYVNSDTCVLTEIVIPRTITDTNTNFVLLGPNKNIRRVIMPSTVLTFALNSLNGVYQIIIPESVTAITMLTSTSLLEIVNYSSVAVSAPNPNCVVVTDINNSTIEIVDDYVTFTRNGTKYVGTYVGSSTSITLPLSLKNYEWKDRSYQTTSGGSSWLELIGVFTNTNVVSVTVPTGWQTLSGAMFANYTTLESISFSNTLKTIGSYCFYGTTALNVAITIPSSVETMGKSVFELSNITSLTIPSSVVNLALNSNRISHGIANNCPELTTLVVNAPIRKLSYGITNCPKLTSLTLPSTLEVMDSGSIRDNKLLSNFIIPSGVTTITDWYKSALGSISWSNDGAGPYNADITILSEEIFRQIEEKILTQTYSDYGGDFWRKDKYESDISKVYVPKTIVDAGRGAMLAHYAGHITENVEWNGVTCYKFTNFDPTA